ncbi:hypothetical protein [Candidatus Mancarchaeum acidiphilum]|nr:hypothetical protein [Candidatus Mancarchaeum acidiphilum]
MVFKNKDLEICNKVLYIADAEKSLREIRNMLHDYDIGIKGDMYISGSMNESLDIYYKDEKVAEVGYSLGDKEYYKLTVYKDNDWKEKLNDIYKMTRLIAKNRVKERNKDPNSSLVLDYKRVAKDRTEEAKRKLYRGSLNDLLDESIYVYGASSKFGEVKDALDKKGIDIQFKSNAKNDTYIDVYHNGKFAAKISRYGNEGLLGKKLAAAIYINDGWQKDLYEIYSRSKELEGEDNQKSELRGK